MRPPRTAPVALWCGIQCVALIAATTGIHLWPHHPDPPESIALAEMVSVQMGAAALLFPIILGGDGWGIVVSLAAPIPMQHLCGALSATPQRVVWITSGHVTLWLLGLAAWAKLARTDLARSCLISAATLLSFGGVLLWYVAAEAAAQTGSPSPNPLHFGPLMSGVAMTALPPIGLQVGWTLVALPLLTAATPLAWVRPRPTPQ